MRIASTALLSFLLFAFPVTKENNNPGKHIARCYGYNPCNACSNCSQCAYCSNGGTCGKCIVAKSPAPARSASSSSYSGQCKATTKSGTRCKRKANSSGYCWQHE